MRKFDLRTSSSQCSVRARTVGNEAIIATSVPPIRVQPSISTSLTPKVRPVRSPSISVVLKTRSAYSSVVASTPEGAGEAMDLCPEPTTKSAPSPLPSTGITPTVYAPLYRNGASYWCASFAIPATSCSFAFW